MANVKQCAQAAQPIAPGKIAIDYLEGQSSGDDSCQCASQVFEEPQKKQMLYWVAAIVVVLFLLYNLIKYSRR